MSDPKAEKEKREHLAKFNHEVLKGDVKAVKKLLEKHKVDINSFDEMKKTPLHYAAEVGNCELIDTLLSAGAKIDICFKYNELTPLHLALLSKKEEAALLLVRKGANVNLETPQRMPATWLAAQLGKRFELRFKEVRPPERRAAASVMAPLAPVNAASAAGASATAATAAPSRAGEAAPSAQQLQAMRAQAGVTSSSQPQPKLGAGASVYNYARDQLLQQQLALGLTETRTRAPTGVRGGAAAGAAGAAAGPKRELDPRTAAERETRLRILRERVQKAEAVAAQLSTWAGASGADRPARPVAPAAMSVAERAQAVAESASAAGKEGEEKEGDEAQKQQDAHVVEVALLMIQHLRSWFDPRVPPVSLPDWQFSKATAAGDPAKTPAKANQLSFTSPLLQFSFTLLDLVKTAGNFQVMNLSSKTFRENFERLNEITKELTKALDPLHAMVAQGTHDRVKDGVETIVIRLKNLNRALSAALAGQDEPRRVALSILQLVGAFFWVYVPYLDCTSAALVVATRDFVASLMGIGTRPNADLECVNDCLRLTSVVNGFAFQTRSPTVCKELSEHCCGLQLTVRALVLLVMQGGAKTNEYNMVVAKHLGRIKEILQETATSRSAQDLTVNDENSVMSGGVELLRDTIAYYEPNVTDPDAKAMLGRMGALPPLLEALCKIAKTTRETGAPTFVPLFDAARAVSAAVVAFSEDILMGNPLFAVCTMACQHLSLQVLLAAVSWSLSNNNCPHHQMAITVRALCFTLVAVMDLSYLNA